ncbi:cytochrome b/b6 domain-containing protein [uncultured Akkermansia sp.]|uniref:cytochrome b/b6 domain-containing protein n=1 Tax=uncultured Akkermansia sp. TaxID=512294 RepID=UPI00262CD0A9|nr:cytochrome b/b6 domain-containing protein [uncultured Akkermansia sp.]
MKATLIDNDLTLAVEDAIPASPVYAPEEILALAVCASPNGSRDAGDLALLHAARERGITLPYAQRENSWEAPSRERPYSTAVLKAADKTDAAPFMVARGNLKALENLCEVSSLEKERMNKAFKEHSPSGFEPVAVAVHRSGAPWRLLGVVPMHAMRDVRRLSMARANFRYFHVWDWPLRVLHWTWVLCIIGLSATGICIAEGWFLKMGDLHGAFQFGTLRFVHYALGWVLVVVMMLRFSASSWPPTNTRASGPCSPSPDRSGRICTPRRWTTCSPAVMTAPATSATIPCSNGHTRACTSCSPPWW